MGGRKQSIESKIDNAISKLESRSRSHIKRHKKDVVCTACGKQIPYTDKTVAARIKEHVASDNHQLKEGNGVQPMISGMFDKIKDNQKKQEEVNNKLTRAFLSADIPLHKLSNPTLRSCLSWMSGLNIPHPNTLRETIVKDIYEDTIERIRNKCSGKDVYFIVDETTDPRSRFCTNIMVGTLDGGREKAMLLNVCFHDRNDNQAVQQSVLESCRLLWPSLIPYPHLVLIISDQAKYMLKAVEEIKKNSLFYPNVSHVTCLAHALSLVACEIQSKYCLVNKYL